MKKVLLLANDSPSFYSFRLELIQELLNSKQYEVYISLPHGKEVDLLIDLGCRFIDTPVSRKSKNPITDLQLLMRYISILRHYKPDIVLTFTIKPNIYGAMACRLLGVPCVTNITGLGSAVEGGGLIQKITFILYRVALKKNKSVFFQNQYNLSFFREHKLFTGPTYLIPGSGVSLKRFTPIEYPSDTTIEFLFIARIMRQKGIDQYLDAARYIRERYPQTVFHILGSCEENYDEILAALHNESVVKYHGQQFDIKPFLARTHCTIHPSFYPEGMSNVLLESAASCRPIITTDRVGCKEIVDNGVSGFIVPQQDSQALIQAVEKFINMPYEDKVCMGLNGRKKVERDFDRQIVVTAYMNEINRCL